MVYAVIVETEILQGLEQQSLNVPISEPPKPLALRQASPWGSTR